MKKGSEKSNTTYLILVGVILATIVLVAVLNSIINNQTSKDVRAKAGNNTGLSMDGIVQSIDTTGALKVTNLKYIDSNHKNGMDGVWTVSPPGNFKTGSLTSGSKIRLGIEPTSVNIDDHSLNALKLEVIK